MIKDGSKFIFVKSKWRCSMVKYRFGLIINRDWKVPIKGTSWLFYFTSFARWLDHKRTLTSDILELHPCENFQLPTSWLSFCECVCGGFMTFLFPLQLLVDNPYGYKFAFPFQIIKKLFKKTQMSVSDCLE